MYGGDATGADTLIPVKTDDLRALLVGKDILRSDDGVVVGDEKNIYGIRFRESVDAVLEGKTDVSHVRADCYGVCSTDTYEDIMENRGFRGVLEYVSDDSIAFYDPESDQFLESPHQPEQERPGMSVEEFCDNSTAGKAVEEALSRYEDTKVV